jgi:hypothetical protein
MRAVVAAETRERPLMTEDTDAVETPAARATSLMVTGWRDAWFIVMQR